MLPWNYYLENKLSAKWILCVSKYDLQTKWKVKWKLHKLETFRKRTQYEKKEVTLATLALTPLRFPKCNGLVSPQVSTLGIATFVESGHRFISWSRLNLHEIRPQMATLGTGFRSRVNVFPSCSSTENIVHLFHLGKLSVINLSRDVVYIRTGIAGESHALLSFLDN